MACDDEDRSQGNLLNSLVGPLGDFDDFRLEGFIRKVKQSIGLMNHVLDLLVTLLDWLAHLHGDLSSDEVLVLIRELLCRGSLSKNESPAFAREEKLISTF